MDARGHNRRTRQGKRTHTSGRKPGDPLMRRTEPVRVMLRPAEMDDLDAVAAAWDVPLAAAAWAIVSTYLSKLRESQAELSEVGLAAVAAAVLGIGGGRLARLPGTHLDEITEETAELDAAEAEAMEARDAASASEAESLPSSLRPVGLVVDEPELEPDLERP